jgi:small ligand-binding sensory domain FIST
VKAGEQLAKPGSMILPGTGTSTAWSSSTTFPLAGFFASGEIGPVGTDSYLHGNTACVAMFREKK